MFFSHTDYRIHQLLGFIGLKSFNIFSIAIYQSMAQGLWLLFLFRTLNDEKNVIVENFDYSYSLILMALLLSFNYLRIKRKGKKTIVSDFENRRRAYRIILDLFMLVYLFFPFLYSLLTTR